MNFIQLKFKGLYTKSKKQLENIKTSRESLRFLSIISAILGVGLLYDRAEIMDKILSWQLKSEFIFSTVLIFISILTSYFCCKKENYSYKNQVSYKTKINSRIKLTLFFLIISTATIIWLLSTGRYSHMVFIAWITALSITAIGLKFIEKTRNFSFRIKRSDFIFLIVLLSIAISLYSYDLNSWKWLSIGDEWAFYSQLPKEGFLSIGGNLFSLEDGVYGTFSPISTGFQAIVVDLIGHTAFAWRFSSQVPVFIAVIILYFALAEIYGRKYAMIGSAIFLSSHYLIAYSHIGYNNTQGLMFISSSILFLYASLRRPTLFNTFMLGATSGISTYFFLGNIFMIPIVVLIFTLYGKRSAVNFLFLVIGILAAISPLIISGLNIIDIIHERSVIQIERNPGEPAEIIAKNSIATIYSPITFNATHFVNGAILDPITSILLILGIGVCISDKKLRFLLLYLLLLSGFLGVLSQYQYPSTNRMVLVMPLLIAVACASFKIIEPSKKTTSIILLVLIVVTVLSANVYKIGNRNGGYYLIEDGLINKYVSENQEYSIYVINLSTNMYIWMDAYFPETKYKMLKIEDLVKEELDGTALLSDLDTHNTIVKTYPPDEVKIYQYYSKPTSPKIYIAEYNKK